MPIPSIPSIKGLWFRAIRRPAAASPPPPSGGPIQYNGVGMIYNDNEITYNYI